MKEFYIVSIEPEEIHKAKKFGKFRVRFNYTKYVLIGDRLRLSPDPQNGVVAVVSGIDRTIGDEPIYTMQWVANRVKDLEAYSDDYLTPGTKFWDWDNLPSPKEEDACGWVTLCESPLEIEHPETGSFASGLAAEIVLDSLK